MPLRPCISCHFLGNLSRARRGRRGALVRAVPAESGTEEGGDSEEYVPQVEVVPEEEVVVQPEPGDALAEAITGGAYEQPTTEPITSARDQGDFYRTPSPAEPPAKPSSPYQKKGR